MRSAMILIVIFLLGMSSTANAQLVTASLHGTVKMTGEPGVTALVRIQLLRSGMRVADIFLREARFEFEGLPEGRYTLLVDAPGFETIRREIWVPGEFASLELRHLPDAIGAAEVVQFRDLKIPKSARTQFQAGQRKVTEDKCADAIALLEKAVKNYPEYGDAHRTLGECYTRLNRWDAAEREFKLALEQPHRRDLHLLLGQIYERSDQKTLSERQLELYAAEK
jgi:tetratricopeptide (TPR) repeat protein